MWLVTPRVADGEAEPLERRDNRAEPHNRVGVVLETGFLYTGVGSEAARGRGPRPGQVRPRTSCNLGAWCYRFDEKAGSGSRNGDCSRIGLGTGAVAFADLGAGDSFAIEARRRSRSSGANSIFLRMLSTSRMTAARSGVGSR